MPEGFSSVERKSRDVRYHERAKRESLEVKTKVKRRYNETGRDVKLKVVQPNCSDIKIDSPKDLVEFILIAGTRKY